MTHDTIRFDPPLTPGTGSKKQSASNAIACEALHRLEEASPLKDALPLTRPPLASCIVEDGSRIVDLLITDSAITGKGLKYSRGDGDSKEETFEAEVRQLRERNQGGFIGFDCERDPGTQRTTLIQVGDSTAVVLYRPKPGGTSLPQCLAGLLLDDNVTKMVVDDTGDSKFIKKDFDLTCAAVMDLQKAVQFLGFRQPGMQQLASYFLRVDVPKIKEISLQFTEGSFDQELTLPQKKYGTEDAIMAYEIGKKVAEVRAAPVTEHQRWKRQFYVGPGWSYMNHAALNAVVPSAFEQGLLDRNTPGLCGQTGCHRNRAFPSSEGELYGFCCKAHAIQSLGVSDEDLDDEDTDGHAYDTDDAYPAPPPPPPPTPPPPPPPPSPPREKERNKWNKEKERNKWNKLMTAGPKQPRRRLIPLSAAARSPSPPAFCRLVGCSHVLVEAPAGPPTLAQHESRLGCERLQAIVAVNREIDQRSLTATWCPALLFYHEEHPALIRPVSCEQSGCFRAHKPFSCTPFRVRRSEPRHRSCFKAHALRSIRGYYAELIAEFQPDHASTPRFQYYP
jgi:hypothetical protein